MQLNKMIRTMREMRQWSQEQMAEKINMSLNGYAKIERGETKLTVDKLDKIAQIFGMDILEFIQNANQGVYFMLNGSADNNTVHYGTDNSLANENEKLRLALKFKDEIIANKELLLQQQQNEIATLKQMIALLNNQ